MFLWMLSHNSKVQVFGHLNRRDFHLFQQRLRNGSPQNLPMKEPEINRKKLKYDKNVWNVWVILNKKISPLF